MLHNHAGQNRFARELRIADFRFKNALLILDFGVRNLMTYPMRRTSI